MWLMNLWLNLWLRPKIDDFAGQAVLITGGSRGIGFVTAQMFLERGARVGICSRDPQRLAAAEYQLSHKGEVQAVVADVRDRHQVQEFVTKIEHRFGRLDVLVNNAGRVWTGDFASQELQSIDEIIEVNIKGVLYATRAVLPIMLQQGSGVIINVSSGAGLVGFPNLVSYCTSKFAVVGFTESLARAMEGRGIRVYGLCPGRVATNMQQEYSGQKIGMPPERVAQKILALAGCYPPIQTGKCLRV